MIAQLSGTVVGLGATWVVLDAGGVGFKLQCPPATSAALRVDQKATLFTALVVREDSLTLFGFTSEVVRDAFNLAQSATGVGPKLALAIVSVLTPARFAAAVRAEDLTALCAVPGIGKKGAQRLVIELKDKVAALDADADDVNQTTTTADTDVWRAQVTDGLQGLGWSARDADAACEGVAHLVEADPTISIGALMKAALRSLARA